MNARTPCQVLQCPDVVFARGLCVCHYFRKRRTGSPTTRPLFRKPRTRLLRAA